MASLASSALVGAILAAVIGAAPVVADPPADPTVGHGQIRGAVVGLGGAPLTGVSIVLAPAGHPEILYATSSDESGKYAFDRLVADQYSIRADGQGLPTVMKVAVAVRPPFRPVLDLNMARTEEAPAPGTSSAAEVEPGRVEMLDGRFLSGGGEPVIEGAVTLRKVGDATTVFYARTGKDGSFTLKDLPAGIYDIATRAPGLIPLHLIARPLRPMPVLYLRLSAPTFPLSFRGWVDDLLPLEVPLPPPHPRPAEILPAAPATPASPAPAAPTEDADVPRALVG
jgi:carboxypeptidase family protein